MNDTDWKYIDEHLHKLAEREASHAHEVGIWLLKASRARVHEHLGHGGFGEYGERVMGYSPRQTYEHLRVAEALESLPLMSKALRRAWDSATFCSIVLGLSAQIDLPVLYSLSQTSTLIGCCMSLW